jgi:hypothetical protein
MIGRPDKLPGAPGDLRKKIARERLRRETISCAACGQLPTPEGHDACLGTLPGVRAACCGHGKSKGYVLFESGLLISGTFEHVPPQAVAATGAHLIRNRAPAGRVRPPYGQIDT